jgi:hypothetical protein
MFLSRFSQLGTTTLNANFTPSIMIWNLVDNQTFALSYNAAPDHVRIESYWQPLQSCFRKKVEHSIVCLVYISPCQFRLFEPLQSVSLDFTHYDLLTSSWTSIPGDNPLVVSSLYPVTANIIVGGRKCYFLGPVTSVLLLYLWNCYNLTGHGQKNYKIF